MKRSIRAEIAQQTVEIVERGAYEASNGSVVNISEAVRNCLASTRHFRPNDLAQLRDQVLSQASPGLATKIEVVNETTLCGIQRLKSATSDSIAALNFASAKNPGGGFLNGSQAQEESLARSSALYASQMKAWDFYEEHRKSNSMLYSDAMILSPRCPVFRDDAGTLLAEPHLITFITSPAPNAGAAADRRPEELASIPEVFQRRTEYALALAAFHGYRNLVLGAWGCGVFRNDPRVVASAFARHLSGEVWRGRFERVVFSVLDTSPSQDTLQAFQQELL